jgi:excisionase family DNA binding protein
MGKICIVRRRKRGPCEPAGIVPAMNDRISSERRCDSVFEEIMSEGEGSISVRLTREQAIFIRSHRHFDRLLGAAGEGVQVDIAQGPEGSIIFNFSFKQVHTVKMLSPKDVCTMLSVSRWLLARLVREERIRSYKIGRLRRFSLADILDYIGASRETGGLPDMTIYAQEFGSRG